MSKKIKEFMDLRDMHYLRPIKDEGSLRLTVEENRDISPDSRIRQESLFMAKLTIGAAVYVPRAGDGEYTAWELARESLFQQMHRELFSEIYPWVDNFLHTFLDKTELSWELRKELTSHINELQDIIRPEK